MYEEKKLTKLTLEVGKDKFTWETPNNDITMEELIQAFYSLCIGVTFHPETVINRMYEWAEERLPKEC